jgi:hypothetical protein
VGSSLVESKGLRKRGRKSIPYGFLEDCRICDPDIWGKTDSRYSFPNLIQHILVGWHVYPTHLCAKYRNKTVPKYSRYLYTLNLHSRSKRKINLKKKPK